jgi:pimeloyl-ACP methyl ester carboxylesterase
MMTTWQSATIKSGDVTIRYQRAGNAIILAHGFSDNGDCWKAFAEPLTATHDVILIDARNHWPNQINLAKAMGQSIKPMMSRR